MTGIAVLVLLPALISGSACSGQLLRLSPAIGDTIDVVERERFGLFPLTEGFQYACFEQDSAGGNIVAVVVTNRKDSSPVRYGISTSQLERIRYLVDHHDEVCALAVNDEYTALSVRRLWEQVELSVATSSGVAVPAPRTSVLSAGRMRCALPGAAAGSCIGGMVASQVSAERLSSGYYEHCLGLPMSADYVVYPFGFLAVYAGITSLGTAAGYYAGKQSEPRVSLPGAGTKWRNSLTTIGTIAGLVAGYFAAAKAYQTLYGRETEFGARYLNGGWAVGVASILTGVTTTLSFSVAFYSLGKRIDESRPPAVTR